MSRSAQEEIYLQIRGQFKAAEKCADKVKELIADYYPNFSKLNRTTLLMIMKMIRKDFKREEWPDVKYMFKSIFVYILADHKPHLFMKNVSELLDVYPEFSDADEVEKGLLLQFRNYFIVACEIIEPKNHKGELIALVGRMCGAIYVTGGGQTTATDRRVLLYERETGIAPRKQPERKRRADDPATLSLQALHSRHNQTFQAIQTRPMFSQEMDPMVNKRPRYEAPDTQTLLRSADSFWSYHRALMETGEDIPYKMVPADQAYSSFAYPSHDLPYSTNHPLAMSNHPAMHPSMRFMHDPLRRPQMPMSMQMQLPPGRPLATPLPLPLSSVANGSKPGSSTGPGSGAPRSGGSGAGNGAGNAGSISHPGPSQMANSSADPHKFQALQQAMSLPPPLPGPPYHPGSYGPSPPMQHYGGYYGGPPPGSYQYPYAYPPPQSMPQPGPVKSEGQFVPRVHSLSQYAPQHHQPQASKSQPQPQGMYGSQFGSSAPYVYSGPASGGYSGPLGPPAQGSAQARPQALPPPPLKPLTYSQLNSPLNSQFNSQSNPHTNSHSQPHLPGPSGLPSAPAAPGASPPQRALQTPHAPVAPLVYPSAVQFEPHPYAPAVSAMTSSTAIASGVAEKA